MTALTDFEPLAKRLKTEISSPTSSSSSRKGNCSTNAQHQKKTQYHTDVLFVIFFCVCMSKIYPSINTYPINICFTDPTVCAQDGAHETVNQNRRPKNTETKMDIRQKSGAGGLRGVKTKGSHHKTTPRQQLKFKNTIERWLVKHTKNSTAEEDVEMTDEDDCQSPSAHSLGACDSDEDTQALTPQDLEEVNPVSQTLKDSPEGRQTLTPDHGVLDNLASSSVNCRGSARHRSKITDFFSRSSSSDFERDRPENSPDKPDSDDENTSSEAESGVTWLGTPIGDLKRMPECGRPLPPLKDVPGLHTVMIRV